MNCKRHINLFSNHLFESHSFYQVKKRSQNFLGCSSSKENLSCSFKIIKQLLYLATFHLIAVLIMSSHPCQLLLYCQISSCHYLAHKVQCHIFFSCKPSNMPNKLFLIQMNLLQFGAMLPALHSCR